MIAKIFAVLALISLPLNIAMWHKSHTNPESYRYDVTLYSSLRVYLRDGVCRCRLLSMPTKSVVQGEFRSSLDRDPFPGQPSLKLATEKQGPFRITWLVFPFWLPACLLVAVGAIPIARGPILQRWRRSRGQCVECGYDLRGSRSRRCSECGATFR